MRRRKRLLRESGRLITSGLVLLQRLAKGVLRPRVVESAEPPQRLELVPVSRVVVAVVWTSWPSSCLWVVVATVPPVSMRPVLVRVKFRTRRGPAGLPVLSPPREMATAILRSKSCPTPVASPWSVGRTLASRASRSSPRTPTSSASSRVPIRPARTAVASVVVIVSL